MRHKKRGIILEREARIDPRERHRTSHKPVGPLGFARTTSETTEEPSRIPVKMAGHPDRRNYPPTHKKHRSSHRTRRR